MAGGITMMLTYGHEVKTADDRFITIAEKGVQTIQAAGVIGAHIVDLIPWRAFVMMLLIVFLCPPDLTPGLVRFIPDWFPGAGIKRLPPGTREDLQTFLHTPFNQVKKQMVRALLFHTDVIHLFSYSPARIN
jgi:hypothetical protein